MLYLRTASGSFISSTMVVGLTPQHGEGGKIVGWLAVRTDGSTTPLASFYSVPGRIEKALPQLFPKSEPIAASIFHRRFVVPYTNKVIRTAKPGNHAHGERGGIVTAAATDSACSSTDCCYHLS
jgi:hypothetical protein